MLDGERRQSAQAIHERYALPMIIVSVAYPKTAQSRFDISYYLQSHTPLVKSRWSGMGLERVDLMHGKSSLNGTLLGFELICLLTFTSLEHMQDALAQHGNEIIADIPNFTDVQPLIQVNEAL